MRLAEVWGAVPAPDEAPFSALNLATWDVQTYVAVLGVLTSIFLAYRAFRKDKSAEVTGQTDVKMRLDALIDERVERSLKAAYDKIDDLESKNKTLAEKVERLEGISEENTQIRDIVRRYFQELIGWDREGRHGPIPMPDPSDVAFLGLNHTIGDTRSQAEARAIRSRSVID